MYTVFKQKTENRKQKTENRTKEVLIVLRVLRVQIVKSKVSKLTYI